jgi:hypothetical protein
VEAASTSARADPAAGHRAQAETDAHRAGNHQHPETGEHTTDENQLGRRNRIAGDLDQDIVADEGAHREHHEEDATAIGRGFGIRL